MTNVFNFYSFLNKLLAQVTEGSTTTPSLLAEAMGDILAKRSIEEVLQRKVFSNQSNKVCFSPSSSQHFDDFKTNKPLLSLAGLQRRNAEKIVEEDVFNSDSLVAGTDVAYKRELAFASCVVTDENKQVVDHGFSEGLTTFPYIPGYLTYREAPIIEDVVRAVSRFDILLVNGHGVAHPRGCGLASQVGLDLGIPTIGVSRALLVGEVVLEEDGLSSIKFNNKTVGAKIEFRGRKPLFVSVGHLVSLETAIRIIKKLYSNGSLPLPLLMAHKAALELKLGKTS